jgi:hypothetical protein
VVDRSQPEDPTELLKESIDRPKGRMSIEIGLQAHDLVGSEEPGVAPDQRQQAAVLSAFGIQLAPDRLEFLVPT